MDDAGFVEHTRPVILIKLEDLGDRHAEGNSRRDDAAGAGPCDIVEIIGKPVIRALTFVDEKTFDLGQYLQGKDAADAAAVNRQKLARPLPLKTIGQLHSSLRCATSHKTLP